MNRNKEDKAAPLNAISTALTSCPEKREHPHHEDLPMIEALASMRPRGKPKSRPADATDWTVINRHPDPETRHDVDTLNAAVDQAMTFFEDPATTTVENQRQHRPRPLHDQRNGPLVIPATDGLNTRRPR